MSPKVEAILAATVLSLCAAASPSLNAVLLLPVLLVALVVMLPWKLRSAFGLAALALLGAVLGAASHGFAQAIFFLLAWRRGESLLWLLTGVGFTAVPFALVAWALGQTGWVEESALAASFAGAGSAAFLVASWGRRGMGRDLRWIPAAVAFLAVVTAVVTVPGTAPVAGPALPAHAGWEPSADPIDRLEELLRRRAAGDAQAGYEAAAHWLLAFGADLDTLRFVCPRFGFYPGAGEREQIELGKRACALTQGRAEEALERVGEDPRLRSVASELRMSLGIDDDHAPEWLRAIYGRGELRVDSWDELNRRLDFREPFPAKRRGLRGMGPGRLLVAPAHDLDSFALTSITKRGGHGYYVDVEMPKGPAPSQLQLSGASRRGIRLELFGPGGEVLRWGCGLKPSPHHVSMPEAFCAGEPGTVTLELGERLQALRLIRLRGEFAIRELRAS